MFELLMSGSHTPEEIILAWQPGQLPSCPSKFQHAKPVIASKVSPDTPIVDAFVGVPVKNPTSFAECHDTNGLRRNDGERQWEAVNRILARVAPVERRGGIIPLDENKIAAEVLKQTLVEYLTQTREPLQDGRRWFIA